MFSGISIFEKSHLGIWKAQLCWSSSKLQPFQKI